VYRLDKDGKFYDYLCMVNIKAIKLNEWNYTRV
jgi:hypothetical protein